MRANIKAGSRNKSQRVRFGVFFSLLRDGESTLVLRFLWLTLRFMVWVFELVVLNRKCVFTRKCLLVFVKCL